MKVILWSFGGMILTGESRSTWIKTCPSLGFSTINVTWNFVEIIAFIDINTYNRIGSYLWVAFGSGAVI
jgi:hypothetical protein